MSKIYLAGKITGLDNYREIFGEAEKRLQKEGFVVMNPARLPSGFEHHEYLHINFAMIDVCDSIYFLQNWKSSKGAIMEHHYAKEKNMEIIYERAEG